MASAQITDRDFGARFAAAWIDNWNRRDIDAVLVHFADDAVFESPLAQTVWGNPVIKGKQDLERYWRAASGRITSLRFVLEDFAWDAGQRFLLVRYVSHTDGKVTRACEAMKFDAAGRQCAGYAYYGYSQAFG